MRAALAWALLAWCVATPDCGIEFDVTDLDGVKRTHRLAVAAGTDATDAALALATTLRMPDPETTAAVLAAQHRTECSVAGLLHPYVGMAPPPLLLVLLLLLGSDTASPAPDLAPSTPATRRYYYLLLLLTNSPRLSQV